MKRKAFRLKKKSIYSAHPVKCSFHGYGCSGEVYCGTGALFHAHQEISKL